MKIGDRDYSRDDIARRSGDLAAAGGVRLVTLGDGAERGLRVLEFRTGSGLAFDVLVDRAMDIGPAEFRGIGVGWRSATGLRHPSLHEYADEDGLSMLRSFSGLLLTAGLDHALSSAVVDSRQFGYPRRATTWNAQHGRLANIPARLLGYGEEWVDGEHCRLWAEGETRQAAVFGEHLRMVRRIECDLGGNEIRLTDRVRNHGFDPTAHMYLYHVNVGWPLLDEGARYEAPVVGTRWQSPSVAEQGVPRDIMPRPLPGFVEQVYEHEVASDADGRVRARLVNPRLRLGFEIEYSPLEFPAYLQWLHLREGGYVVGLEPSTHHVEGAAAAIEDGTMIWLDAGEHRDYHVTLRIIETD